MTERMENALNHIKTSVDVDPWAVEEVERVFKAIDDIKAEILEEKDFAYADFEQYKVDILGVDPEYVEDELPNDDFRYGMERCLEIILKHVKVGDLN